MDIIGNLGLVVGVGMLVLVIVLSIKKVVELHNEGWDD